jgi:hypothetical protein
MPVIEELESGGVAVLGATYRFGFGHIAVGRCCKRVCHCA